MSTQSGWLASRTSGAERPDAYLAAYAQVHQILCEAPAEVEPERAAPTEIVEPVQDTMTWLPRSDMPPPKHKAESKAARTAGARRAPTGVRLHRSVAV